MPMPMAGMSTQPYIFAALALVGFLALVAGTVIVAARLNRFKDRGRTERSSMGTGINLTDATKRPIGSTRRRRQ
ncbi:MAG: hypothetical protein HKL81_05350 [Acidimicrobiaceae bacterium]|nr:hypothetical protein [Acidimicrobiaceae bacterium]